jgi:ferredoxin-like protein FixX
LAAVPPSFRDDDVRSRRIESRLCQKMRLGRICDVYYMKARKVQRGELHGLVSAENCNRCGLCRLACRYRANLPIRCLVSPWKYCTSVSLDLQVIPIETRYAIQSNRSAV